MSSDNQLTEEVAQALVSRETQLQAEIDRAAAKVKEAKAAKKKHHKFIQSLGIKQAVFDRIYQEIMGTAAEDRAEELAQEARLAKLLNLPYGHQLELGFDSTPLDERAYYHGKTAYHTGAMPSENPHDPASPAGQKWLEGFHDAQALVAAGMTKIGEIEAEMSKEARPKVIKGRKKKDEDADPLDAAA